MDMCNYGQHMGLINSQNKFLNVPVEFAQEALDNIQLHTTSTCLDETKYMDKVTGAVMDLKYGRTPGGAGIPAEVLVLKLGRNQELCNISSSSLALDKGTVP